MSDVIGAAQITVTPDMSNFAADLTAAIGPALSQAQSSFDSIGSSANTAGEEIKTGIGGAVTSVGDIVKGVAIGNLISDGIEAGVGIAIESLKSLTSFLPELGEQFFRAFQTIRIQTGETGPALDSMKQSFNDVFAKTPASAEEVAGALAKVNTRLDLTGDAAEASALQLIRLARIAGADVNTVVDEGTAIFNNFGVSVDKQKDQLDKFLRVSQETGVPVEKLLGTLTSTGLAFKAAGFSIDETAALIGNLSKVGLDATSIQMGLGRAVAKAAKEGKPAREALDALFTTIKTSAKDTDATAAAVDAFGTRAGPRLAELIRSGRLSYADLVKTIRSGGDTIDQATKDTATWRGALALMAHELQIVVEPIAVMVFEKMGDAMRAVRPIIVSVAQWVAEKLSPAFQSLVIALVPVWKFFDKAREGVKSFMDVIASGGTILDGLGAFFTDLLGQDAAQKIYDGLLQIGDAISTLWAKTEPARKAIADAFFTIKDAVGKFISDHPDVVLAGFAGTITAIVIPAIVGLAGAILGLVLSLASPAVLIGVLAGALYYAYTQSDTFRNGVDGAKDALVDFYNWLSNDGQWTDFKAGIESIRGVLDPIIGTLQTFYGWVSNDGAWTDFRAGVQMIGDALNWVKNEIIDPVVGSLQAFYGWVSNDGAWTDFKAGVQTISDAVKLFRENVLDPIIGTLQTIGEQAGKAFENFKNTVSTVWDTFRWGKDNVLDPIFGTIQSITDRLREFGKTLVAFYNNTIPAIVKSQLGLPDQIQAFAQGGVVPGPLGAPQLAMVHGGELIIPPEILSGLSGGSAVPFMGAAPAVGDGGGSPINIYVTVPEGTTNPEAVGAAFGDAAGEAFVRRTNIKTAVRTSPSSAR